jgi:DNA-directed RNA polymerase specialized sigma24 family protein
MFDKEQLNKYYRYCIVLHCDEFKAFELLKECLTKFYRYSIDLKTMSFYVYKMIKLDYIKSLAKSDQLKKGGFLYFDHPIISLSTSFKDIIISQKQFKFVYERLSLEQRELIYFLCYEEFNLDEVAELLGSNKGGILAEIEQLRKIFLFENQEHGISE